MKTEEKLGSVKRFGARYGRKLKIKFSKIEAEQRKLHKCPYCNKIAVKRVAVGIWNCKKCKAKFTGKAYSISNKITAKESELADEEQPVLKEETLEDRQSSEAANG